ncbi:hypothetical protein OIU76_016273 [Salix suchowensis]|nr:hypothetical protein OIU76_016273 [Salix suchowensis]
MVGVWGSEEGTTIGGLGERSGVDGVWGELAKGVTDGLSRRGCVGVTCMDGDWGGLTDGVTNGESRVMGKD